MCKPASFVVTKDRVFWSRNTDSHEEIIREFELTDYVHGEATLVRVEIAPEDGNLASAPKTWVYKLDQDIKPKWYDAEDVERRCRRTLSDWRKAKLILDGAKVAVITDGEHYMYGGTIHSVYGGTIQYVDGGTIQYVGGGTIKSVGGGTIQSVGGGTIRSVRGGTIQSVYGGTIQYAGGGTIQSVYGGTIHSVYGGTIHSVDGGTIHSVYGGTIQSVRGGTIQYVYGGTIIVYRTTDPSILKCGTAVMVDRSVKPPKCYVGIQKESK